VALASKLCAPVIDEAHVTRQAHLYLLQAAGENPEPAKEILGAFRDALPGLWPLWVALGVVASVSLIVGLIKRIVRHRRLSRSGIDDIDKFGGETFEQYLQILFHKLGYRVERTQFRGDYGGDLVLRKDGVRTVVQAKRYTKSVGVKAVQEAVAAKGYYNCTEAMVVTNSCYTKQAAHLARKNGVVLWDRDMLIRRLHDIDASDAMRSVEPPASSQAAVQATPSPSPAATLPSVEACQQCAKVLTAGERQYCERNARRFDGRMLCFRHQRTKG
jgi:restriction system protein